MTKATFYYIKNGKIIGKEMPVDEFKKLLSEGNSNKKGPPGAFMMSASVGFPGS